MKIIHNKYISKNTAIVPKRATFNENACHCFSYFYHIAFEPETTQTTYFFHKTMYSVSQLSRTL